MKKQVRFEEIKVLHGIHTLKMEEMNKYYNKKRKGTLENYEGYVNVYEKDGQLILLSNRFGYEIAKMAEQEFITARIIDVNSREEYMQSNGYSDSPIILMKSVMVTRDFKDTTVGKSKLKRVHKFYEENNCLDKPITVELQKVGNRIKPVLTDGLSRYVVAKRLGLRTIECVISNPNMIIEQEV